jgi:hypothetical protein
MTHRPRASAKESQRRLMTQTSIMIAAHMIRALTNDSPGCTPGEAHHGSA